MMAGSQDRNKTRLADIMTLNGDFPEPDPLRTAIQAATLADETTLIERIRDHEQSAGGLDAFMHEYDLSSSAWRGRGSAIRDLSCAGRWRGAVNR